MIQKFSFLFSIILFCLFINSCKENEAKHKRKKVKLDSTFILTIDGDTLMEDYSSAEIFGNSSNKYIQIKQYKYSGEDLDVFIHFDSVTSFPHKFIFAGPNSDNDNPGKKIDFNWKPKDWDADISHHLHEYPTGISELTISELDTIHQTVSGYFSVEVNSLDTKKYKTHFFLKGSFNKMKLGIEKK